MTVISAPPSDPSAGSDLRNRVLAAAASLLAEGGRAALTTRAIVAAAGIQQPTLYRLFGDKDGLLEAVAETGLAAYVATKTMRQPDPDPLTEFRLGWDRHVGFGLSYPALFAIIWGDPNPARISPAAAAGQVALQQKVHALAVAGLLRVSEGKAVDLAHAACTGAILTLLAVPESDRDLDLATSAREAVIAAITRDAPIATRPGPADAAIALRASLGDASMLTRGEKLLLTELLDRIADAAEV